MTAATAADSRAADESWPMIEEAVFRLFDDAANSGEHVAIGPQLAELGWADIETEYPIEACQLLFRAQGRTLATTDCLVTVMLAELAALLDGPVDGVVLPISADGPTPASGQHQVTGLVLGPLARGASGRLVVPVRGPMGTVSIGLADHDGLTGQRLDTFDSSVHWTQVRGPLESPLIDASTEWARALGVAHRALATELIALADEAMRITIEHVSVRQQFGSAIGSFQAPRHALADAAAGVEAARAVLQQSWLYGGRLSAVTAKVAAGRAHRGVSDATLQACGAIGLTAEHPLHRYVRRGFQLDALCGSYTQLEALLADRLFDTYAPGRALPGILSWD
ncbi:acyl-CoA dehydrogenase family protein [Mycobacterium sp.]|uniref:acyl-CoA dehydrogenase family protein n=1 Tax=Mycobacterium sp. TaxID=1785 RepID=UPI003D124C45